MKKLFVSIFIGLALFVNTAFAQAENEYIMDFANILSDSEEQVLENEMARLSSTYDCGIYIVTFDDMGEYGYGEYEIEDFAFDTYMEFGLGLNDTKDGLLFVMSMKERDFDIMAYGKGNEAFTDYGKDALVEAFASSFRSNEWFKGMKKYLKKTEYMLKWFVKGHPYDRVSIASKAEGLPMNALRGLIVGLIIAFFSGKVASRKRSTVQKALFAYGYIDSSNVKISSQEDKYLRTSTSVRYISSNSNSGGGHSYGGTSIHSNGSSHRSGKF